MLGGGGKTELRELRRLAGGVDRGGPLKIGVIGVGVMGSNHARVLSEMAGVTLVGVVDPDRTQREFVGRTLGCAEFTDIESLVRAGVEAVTIAAPTHLHHDLALDCISRGLHVMVEKPIAPTVEEGGAIVAAARRAGVTLMVGHVERFNPAVESIKRGIEGGYPLDGHFPRRPVPAARVGVFGVVHELAVADVLDLIPLAPQLGDSGDPAAIVERGGQAQGCGAASSSAPLPAGWGTSTPTG